MINTVEFESTNQALERCERSINQLIHISEELSKSKLYEAEQICLDVKKESEIIELS